MFELYEFVVDCVCVCIEIGVCCVLVGIEVGWVVFGVVYECFVGGCGECVCCGVG